METQKLNSIPKQVSAAVNLILTAVVLMIVSSFINLPHVVATEKDIPYWLHVAVIPMGIAAILLLVYKIYAGRNWARWIYLIAVAPNAFTIFPIAEIFQRSSLLGALLVAEAGITSAIIYLLFFSSGKQWFQKQTNTTPPTNEKDSDAPKKKFNWMEATFGLLIALIALAGLVSIFPADKPKPLEAAYNSAQAMDYRKAMLVQIETGALLVFEGEISQTVGDMGAMIATGTELIAYVGNPVYLNFESKPQVIDGDVVRILGRYSGKMKYETIFGAEKEIPLVTVDYYKVVKPKR